MVSFVCDNCGNGFRKNQVESHMNQCGARMVSCVDCSQNFNRTDFKGHIRCITESEKYESKSSYVQKANKGDVKQNAWFENVLNAVETFRGSQRAKELLEKLTDFPNIPRKKAKFFNFMKNSFRSYGVHDGLLNEIWAVIENFDKKPAAKPAVTAPVPVVDENNNDNKKRKLDKDESSEEKIVKKKTVCEEVKAPIKFDWIESSKLECSRKTENEISFKKLFKKILKEYKQTEEAQTCEIEVEELKNKLLKKLRKKSSKFEVSAESDADSVQVKCIAV